MTSLGKVRQAMATFAKRATRMLVTAMDRPRTIHDVDGVPTCCSRSSIRHRVLPSSDDGRETPSRKRQWRPAHDGRHLDALAADRLTRFKVTLAEASTSSSRGLLI